VQPSKAAEKEQLLLYFNGYLCCSIGIGLGSPSGWIDGWPYGGWLFGLADDSIAIMAANALVPLCGVCLSVSNGFWMLDSGSWTLWISEEIQAFWLRFGRTVASSLVGSCLFSFLAFCVGAIAVLKRIELHLASRIFFGSVGNLTFDAAHLRSL